MAEFFDHNLVVIYFSYGLAFFSMGLAIWLGSARFRTSEFRLAGALLFLAGFGVVHGMQEWFEMIALLNERGGTNIPEWLLLPEMRLLHLLTSFLLLIFFGIKLLYANRWAGNNGNRFALLGAGAFLGLGARGARVGSQVSEEQRKEVIRRTSIFSRVVPAQKLMIVNALKENGEVVAMTGDGINDAPALKAAHIGIAMGKRGTDVAREAASIVLLDDNFASIVRGVRLGRRIFANLQKAMMYILAVHMPIITLSLLPVFFGWPLVLLPIHIVFIEFIIDPSCTLIFEGEDEEPDTMDKPPRKLGSALFSRSMIVVSVLSGGVISALIIVAHALMLSSGWSEDKARAITFLLVILTNVMMILAVSGRRVVARAFLERKINALAIVVVVVAVALTAIYTVAPIRGLFHIEPISLADAAGAFVVALLATSVVVPLRRLIMSRY